jgi:Tol biopolymer transport system component
MRGEQRNIKTNLIWILSICMTQIVLLLCGCDTSFNLDLKGGGDGEPTEYLYSIKTIKTDGGDPQVLIESKLALGWPIYSMDGSKIYFVWFNFEEGNCIWEMTVNGKNRKKLMRGNFQKISPDGVTIAYVGSAGSGVGLWLMTLSNKNKFMIDTINLFTITHDFQFSPDGSKIVYVNKDYEIIIFDISSNSKIKLSGILPLCLYPHFSPDGNIIVFTAGEEGTRDIYSVDISSLTLTNLTNSDSDEWSLLYSPDGSKIVFVTAGEGYQDVWYQMDFNGNNQEGVSYFMIEEGIYSPDGLKVAYCYNHNLYFCNVDGSNEICLDESEYDIIGDISFSSDWKEIVYFTGNKLN